MQMYTCFGRRAARSPRAGKGPRTWKQGSPRSLASCRPADPKARTKSPPLVKTWIRSATPPRKHPGSRSLSEPNPRIYQNLRIRSQWARTISRVGGLNSATTTRRPIQLNLCYIVLRSILLQRRRARTVARVGDEEQPGGLVHAQPQGVPELRGLPPLPAHGPHQLQVRRVRPPKLEDLPSRRRRLPTRRPPALIRNARLFDVTLLAIT